MSIKTCPLCPTAEQLEKIRYLVYRPCSLNWTEKDKLYDIRQVFTVVSKE